VKRELLQNWLAKAEKDLAVAEHLLLENATYLDAVGFHAQQAAEKFLKAFLVQHQIEFPKTHDLDELLDIVATVESALAESLRDVIVLTQYGVDVRYLGDFSEITPEDARRAVKLAGKVREAILNALKVL